MAAIAGKPTVRLSEPVSDLRRTNGDHGTLKGRIVGIEKLFAHEPPECFIMVGAFAWLARALRKMCACRATRSIVVRAQRFVLEPGANIVTIDVNDVARTGPVADCLKLRAHMFAKPQIARSLTILHFTAPWFRND